MNTKKAFADCADLQTCWDSYVQGTSFDFTKDFIQIEMQ